MNLAHPPKQKTAVIAAVIHTLLSRHKLVTKGLYVRGTPDIRKGPSV